MTVRRQLERGVNPFVAVDHDRCVRPAMGIDPDDEHDSSLLDGGVTAGQS
jgi:hypothetical protein